MLGQLVNHLEFGCLRGLSVKLHHQPVCLAPLIAGKNAPRNRSMGHAGAIVAADGSGSAANKETKLRQAGVLIAETTAQIVDILAGLSL